MTTLHLGVIEQPYDDGEGKTTGDVADILEAKYHIMEIFAEVHGDEIADDLAQGFQGTLESLLSNRPVDPDDIFNAGTTKIEDRFHDFILGGEMEALGYPGVPTGAAIKGVNHRLAHPYAKANPSRQSFIDTGLYEASFKAWIDTTDWASLIAGAGAAYYGGA